jgi:small subunit ribosomal protein S9
MDEKKKISKKELITGTGRRKTAVARVFLYQTKGDFLVNDKNIDLYFPTEKEKLTWMKPFHAIGVSHPNAQFSATLKIVGSGKSAQLGAVSHAFARSLAKIDAEYAKILRKQGFLTRDSRMVERKKYYLRKARKAPQYSKR